MLYCKLSKQKLNSKSSTEAELIASSDMMGQMLWTLYFLRNQGYDITDNVLNQDNKSTIKLQENGKMSSSQRTWHINIRYFFIKDKIEKEEISVVYCPTKDMIGDYFTKPLQGQQFVQFRNMIMGIISTMTEECVGESGTDSSMNHKYNGQEKELTKVKDTIEQAVNTK
jgi:hypothetical protein